MRKSEELADPNSCMTKARDDEMTFVLLGRDPAAPAAIRSWVAERLNLHKNWPADPQITEAIDCAAIMERERVGLASGQVTPDRLGDVLADVRSEAKRALVDHGEFRSAHEAYGVLAEEVDEFWAEVKKKRADRSPAAMRAELIQVAAVAIKAAACLAGTVAAANVADDERERQRAPQNYSHEPESH